MANLHKVLSTYWTTWITMNICKLYITLYKLLKPTQTNSIGLENKNRSYSLCLKPIKPGAKKCWRVHSFSVIENDKNPGTFYIE